MLNPVLLLSEGHPCDVVLYCTLALVLSLILPLVLSFLPLLLSPSMLRPNRGGLEGTVERRPSSVA